MTSYQYLSKFIPGGSGVNDNWFCPVEIKEVLQSEEKIRAKFPEELRNFYLNIGFGMLRSPDVVPPNYNFYSKNEILPPHIAVDYMLGNLEHPDEPEYYMSRYTYDLLKPGDLPFFEIGEGSSFLVMKPNSENPNAVWSDCGIKIEDSFERFVWRLYYENPGYYGDIITKAHGIRIDPSGHIVV